MASRVVHAATAVTMAAALALSTPPAASAGSVPARTLLPKPLPCARCWHPAVRSSWMLQLGSVPTAPYRNVAIYDVDAVDTPASTVSAMHSRGIRVICYLSAGTFESWRPDAGAYPAGLLGASNGWPGERWVDVRDFRQKHSVLRTILDARLDLCRQKGFDAVDPDNIDGYANDTGFAISSADQLLFNTDLANDAHLRGLAVMQKNDLEQTPTLVRYFDGSVNEQCNEYSECTTADNGGYGLDEYVRAGKPAFQVEYDLSPEQFCPEDNANDFNGVLLDLALDGKRFVPCR